ncbi:hypothetical protein QE152_g31282 [Popillia japonica]|uniref:Integrase catalytic domain-containing protein n=1 Tax=Popillia japonica TaxID=7064 RepID=A0AAW1JBB0_POPJA
MVKTKQLLRSKVWFPNIDKMVELEIGTTECTLGKPRYRFRRYPIVEVISALDARTVTKKLRHIFAMFGLPKRLKSDDGPPFSSNNFKVFLDEFNIEHHRITPYWPEANGLAERSVRSIKKAILCANIENKNLKEELDNFLLNYRSTQHSTTA